MDNKKQAQQELHEYSETLRTEKTQQKKKKRFYRHIDVNNGQRSFAAGLNVYKLIWVFAVGCVIGVVFETLYVYLMEGDFKLRTGMIFGPFNQVYGFGALLFTICLYRFRKKNALIIFFASFFMGLAFEYVMSWAQEVLFGSVSWEYSDMPFNIGGRTNLLYGVAWGMLGVIFIIHAWPFLSEFIERIPNTIGKSISIFLAVFLCVDMLLSAAAVSRWQHRITGAPATNAITRTLDNWFPDEFMESKYSSMQNVRGKAPQEETDGSRLSAKYQL